MMESSRKSFMAAWLLSLLLGTLGADRFYLGKIGTGVLKLVTLGGFGIWWLIDLIMLLAGKTTDSNGLELEGYDEKKRVALFVTIGYYVLTTLLAVWYTVWLFNNMDALLLY
jgi:hypothetical protein